ncbi:hypothetical protein B7494_g7713 [Chlorociboria aeruginascens]|nr:hypothetical protein B7494_g7713 [Chlorociboria aeruginascens]
MDPITATGLAISIASLAGQVFQGCIQGIQFIITAKNLPEECKYLNLRLRMEQQRLFAWSETSGLLDLDNANDKKIRESNTFVIHRTTILDLLVQIQCLFKEFEKAQKKNGRLKIAPEPVGSDEEFISDPAKDASNAHVPLPETRRKYIIKAMNALKTTKEQVNEGRRRLMWAAFDKETFEALLQRFSTLNNNMTDILDARLQTEIYRTTQDTNRGVLQLHKDLSSLQRLVMALDIKMQARIVPQPEHYVSANDASGLRLLAQLAKFKAFNESMDSDSSAPWDEATAMVLQLGKPDAEKASTKISRSDIILSSKSSTADIRCEAVYVHDRIKQKVWIEWKEYDYQTPGMPSPPKLIVDRVQKLAALLHHSPKPEAFRVPHCIGYFDNASPGPLDDTEVDSEGDDDGGDTRIGFIFEKPLDEGVSPDTAPISLFDLLLSSPKPRVTDRIRLAHALANCLLYLHSVNWLHKGLRSHNIVFFPISQPKSSKQSNKPSIDYAKPYLSGFDFARPARKDEMTEIPGDIPEYNMYRHPATQGFGFGPRESFRKTFDIYSLGVVMVELAYWQTIDKVLGIETEIRSGKGKGVREIRDRLLEEEMVRGVGANMGEVFEEATGRCIAGGKELGVEEEGDEMGDKGAAVLGMRFYEDVVKRLGDVKV